MEKKRLYVPMIAVVFVLILILPASAAISFQKYTPDANTMFKPIPIRIPSIPIKNISVIDQPQLIPSIQKPVDLQIPVSPRLFNNSALVHRVQTEIPINLAVPIQLPFTVTVTVWNADHSKTVPGASVEFIETFSNSGGIPSGGEIFTTQLATGITDSKGKLSTNLQIKPYGDRVTIVARGPVISENGEQVHYSGSQMLSYKSKSIDITLDRKYRLVEYPNGMSFWLEYL